MFRRLLLHGLATSLAAWPIAAQADGEHYMKIDSEWQLGVIVKNDAGKEEFVTCPGAMRYELDANNLKPTADTCKGRGGVFFGELKFIGAGDGTYAVTTDDGVTETWHFPSASGGTTIAPGKSIFLEIIDKDKMVAKPYEVMMQPSAGTVQ